MTEKIKSEPAFPTTVPDDDNPQFVKHYLRISLRDYFAAKALQGMLADHSRNGSWEEYAIDAYKIADAMLKSRDK